MSSRSRGSVSVNVILWVFGWGWKAICDLSAKENNHQPHRHEVTNEPDGRLTEGGSSRQLVIALPGPLAVSSLAQDAREAGGTVAPLVVVARAAVLAPKHGVVAHPSCRKHKAKRAGKTGGWLMGRQRAKKTDRQFYGLMHIFRGTKRSRKILAKQKSKQTVAAMRWNEWAGNQRLPAHCETRRLHRTTISSCYILLL